MYIFISRCTSESTFKLLTSTLGIIHILIPLVLSNTYSLQCATPTKLKYSEFNIITLVCFLLRKVTYTESYPTFIHISDMY